MKHIDKILLIAFISLSIFLILFRPSCNDNTTDLKDNTTLLNSLEIYKAELVDLKRLNDSLELSYQNNKNLKDSIVYDIRTRYKTYYDTITNDTIECLPKIYVDKVVLTYENLLNDSDTLIKVKSLTIENLTTQNTIKDTIINNYQDNELIYKQEIKKQKKKKWLFGAAGTGIGYFLGKIF